MVIRPEYLPSWYVALSCVRTARARGTSARARVDRGPPREAIAELLDEVDKVRGCGAKRGGVGWGREDA